MGRLLNADLTKSITAAASRRPRQLRTLYEDKAAPFYGFDAAEYYGSPVCAIAFAPCIWPSGARLVRFIVYNRGNDFV